MTAKALADYIRYKTRTNSTTFPDTDMLPLVQFRQDELARKLMAGLSEDEDIFQTPETRDLELNKREYAFPLEILGRVKRVEAKLDGTNWILLKGMDLSEYRFTTDEATIVQHFANLRGMAKYDLGRKALTIYSGSITAVTGGLKLWCFNYPLLISDLTDNTEDMEDDPSTTTHGFPRELHELLARGVIIDYKESREKPIPLSERELSFDKDVAGAIEVLKHGDVSREIIGFLPPAYERGMNGMNY